MLIPDLPAPAVTRDSTTIFAGLRLSVTNNYVS